MSRTNKRPRGRPFQPGESGNPGGRPRGLTELRLAARAHTMEALNILVSLMRSKRVSASSRVRAINALLDRAWGKPVQELLVEGAMVIESHDNMTRDELARDMERIGRECDERLDRTEFYAPDPARPNVLTTRKKATT